LVLHPDAHRESVLRPVEADRVATDEQPPLVDAAALRRADVGAGPGGECCKSGKGGKPEPPSRRAAEPPAQGGCRPSAHRVPRASPTPSEIRCTPCAFAKPRWSSVSVVKR